jgi:hypothetical protein
MRLARPDRFYFYFIMVETDDAGSMVGALDLAGTCSGKAKLSLPQPYHRVRRS